MILESLEVDLSQLAARLGWDLKPEGLCRDGACVPLRDGSTVASLAAALQRPLVEDAVHHVWALGPESGRALVSARAPELTLPAWGGGDFKLSSLLGQKVLIVAWAPW